MHSTAQREVLDTDSNYDQPRRTSGVIRVEGEGEREGLDNN